MTDSFFSFWNEQEASASFSEPGACETRATEFEKVVKRRNMIEYAAGALVIGMFGLMAILSAIAGEWLFLLSAIAVLAAAVFVALKLHRYGSALARRPEEDCRTHLRSQLVRQRDLLRGVPKWYLAPFVPGLFGFYFVVTTKVAEAQGWAVAIEGVWTKVAATAALFLFLWWLNAFAARKLDREIDTLDRA